MNHLDEALAALSARPVPADLVNIDSDVLGGLRQVVADDRQFRRAALTVAGLTLLVGGTIGGAGTSQAEARSTMPLGVPSTLAPSTLLDPGL